jgi:hypothetical protein
MPVHVPDITQTVSPRPLKDHFHPSKRDDIRAESITIQWQ